MQPDSTWIARALEGDLDEAEYAKFLHALEHDAALLEAWARHAVLHGLLGPALETAATRDIRVAACLKEAARKYEDGFVRAVEKKIRWVQFRRGATWATAAVFLIGMLGLWNLAKRPPLAIVVGVHGSMDVTQGQRFSKGRKLNISSGLVELDLAGHGRMIVEGPAEITWTTPLDADLQSGRVFLKINDSGKGYRITTPQGSIVDLGTEFGISIDRASGRVETHVLKGIVEALPRMGSEPVRLNEKQALRFSSDAIEPLAASPGEFYHSLPPIRRQEMSMVHWPMNVIEDDTVIPRTRNLGDDSAVLDLTPAIKSVEGPFGTALQFDGKHTSAESDYRGIADNHPRTVAFWVKAPSDLKAREHYGIIGWGKYDSEDPTSMWQISLNHNEYRGTQGAIILEVKSFRTIGSTDLRDDQWHHIAVVLHPQDTPGSDQQVMIFVDGKMQTLTNRMLPPIQTEVDRAPHGVRVGRYVSSPHARWQHFRGAIDEVYIFDDVLTQEEIRMLMKHNQPPSKIPH